MELSRRMRCGGACESSTLSLRREGRSESQISKEQSDFLRSMPFGEK